MYHKISYEWLKKILVNSDGGVNGTVLTAVVASLALIINTWYRQKEYKANLISKARVTWLNTAREITASVSSLALDLAYGWDSVFELRLALQGIDQDKIGVKGYSKEEALQKIRENITRKVNDNNLKKMSS
ncbi:hypothetical protein NHG29_05105 [Aerococcaceae bacterium NML160702]|nr:hypothetical protein [Aerococcaceae bacterium NML160702]